MSVTFQHRGEPMTATFFTRAYPFKTREGSGFPAVAQHLEQQRIQRYVLRNSEATEADVRDWQKGFFDWEPIAEHDDIMMIHRGPHQPGNPPGIGEVVGLVAVDRAGNPSQQPFPNAYADESLLLEKRLAPLGFRLPRPRAWKWIGPEPLPLGVFAHWHPHIARDYFQPDQIFWGDTIHINAYFADDGLGPLVHELANGFGLFTGRMTYDPQEGRRVYLPTEVVWEVFNRRTDKGIKQGSRTRFYKSLGAGFLTMGRDNQWNDPRLAPGNLVQVMFQGADFRETWTEKFLTLHDFSLVRDVSIQDVHYEYVQNDGQLRLERPSTRSLQHLPKNLNSCILEVLAARANPPKAYHQPIQVSLSLGGSAPVVLNLQTDYAGHQPMSFTPNVSVKLEVDPSRLNQPR